MYHIHCRPWLYVITCHGRFSPVKKYLIKSTKLF